ncbi:MAG: hydroxyethylthiazole kinase [Christensenellaceae bacterium]|jgi:hydroxyethylthiazole kinase|nr:hydroxyethylthiazole kinase [Christensenellaceae bacterium]
MLGFYFDAMRRTAPLVHCMTNHVTANDCANLLLAAGASPIMAEDPAEVEELTAASAALTLNIGALRADALPAMLAAGKRANALGHPVVFDPVGAGISAFRSRSARALLEEIRFSAIRGNLSEIKALALGLGGARGVDAAEGDRLSEGSLSCALDFLKAFAARAGAVVAATGEIDLVTDGLRSFAIRNGHPMMARVTGSGCMLSALAAGCLAGSPQAPLEAVAAAICAMGLAGEIAASSLPAGGGSASLRSGIIDAIYHMDGAALNGGERLEIR